MSFAPAKHLLPATKHLSSAIVLAGALLAGLPALAQTAQEHRYCEGEDGASVAQRIDACSAVIKAGRDKGDKLAEAFNNRGVGYRLKGDHDRAIADYAQAIKLNAKFAAAFNNRGVAYDKKGEFDRAIQDYDQAIKLKPAAEAHFNRGNAYLGKSQYASPSTTTIRRSSSRPILPAPSITAAGRARS